jgi:hypothetical protein
MLRESGQVDANRPMVIYIQVAPRWFSVRAFRLIYFATPLLRDVSRLSPRERLT